MTGTYVKQTIVKRDGDRDIKFIGELLAEADNIDSLVYSNSGNSWTELRLYRMKGGKYVCQRVERNSWSNVQNEYEACVCEDVDRVVDFFGHGPLAKELFRAAEISAVLEVE
ncbi:hypothetical protein J2X76_005424 [Neorhizobium sp. 2083]|uniref:hypothetical protein n=1 Tax=Neorhizobium sp. 2083 TaxID=2817762 RepID=UPI00285AF1EF|nr:hypothetical protein [Neorhizobium sp. 2083]MDR6820227.1 hypothetical protein [Neorhizobium sp. 2083]